MNTFNKNVRRTVSIFVLLTLCVGLCFEVAAFPLDVMAVGELHELDDIRLRLREAITIEE
jgi:hypothetical protein